MNRFIVVRSLELNKWIIQDTHRWTPDGKWIDILETASDNKKEVQEEAKQLNRGIGLNKYQLPNKGMS